MARGHTRRNPHSLRSADLFIFGLGTAAVASTAHAQFRFAEPDIYLSTLRSARGVALVDLDGDARIDAIICGREGSGPGVLHFYFNLGNGELRREFDLEVPASPLSIDAGDFDADGHLDIVWTDSSSRVYVFYNRGDGRGGEMISVNAVGSRVHAADLDGDGHSDIILQLFRSPTVIAMMGRGRGEFEQVILYRHADPRMHAKDMAVGDVDGDGDIDLAVTYGKREYVSHDQYDVETELVSVVNDGRGAFSEAARWPLPWRGRVNGHSIWEPQQIGSGDLDGDGDHDFIITARDSGCHFSTIHAFRNDGFRIYQIAQWLGDDCGTTALKVIDLDLDGRLDVLVADAYLLWAARNLGDGQFSEPQRLQAGVDSLDAACAADVYADGQWDIAVFGRHDPSGDPALAIVQNVTFTSGPRLVHSDLTRGRPAAFAVRDAQPGERVHFLYSFAGAGHAHGQPLLGGMVLDLLEPITLFGSAVADADGTAVLRRIVPPNAPLRNVVFQAVIRRGPGGEDSVKTPFRTARIEPN